MNEFTGERVIPGQVEIDLWNEHFARYAFASQFVANRRVLDVGCGSGYGAAELSRSARYVAAVDVSEEAAAYARQHFPMEHFGVACASAASLPFPPACFDLVTAFEVIEHVDCWPELIREARRVLSSEGRLLISTPNKAYYAESRGSRGANPFHVHEFEAAEFEAALAEVFPHVALLLESRSEAMVFYPSKAFLETAARIDSSGGSREDAHFFVAICCEEPLEDLNSFVYVPRAANVLREREQHIRKLEGELELNRQWLEETRCERAQLLVEHAAQTRHLEEQNRWALALEREWKATQQRIVDLQDAASADAARFGERLGELEQENRDKTEWALETERRLSVEVEHFRAQLAGTVERLGLAEETVVERSRWALDLQTQLEHAQELLSAVRASRWLRTGRWFGAGPEL